ncbi:hypothetical protein [Mycolicibacterium smegmatis]|uniref:Uncharacterized protein n=4 Tax=Mycolicibacterium smegmatis TaxID=1772 RepID=I7FDN6_MYCS2|nr:hypothetical protein [Mycolicibacterium smegmatis]ABK71850.1 hypothetical protein MSMEG_0563 [Mycolicibacterium smegmatis MC2 155]AFP37028.1 hypothetical protein MSMEI_0547 [Mycolicibacterium smegmatis MC2 155]AIU05831.1 hypothetical protein LJ00_02790 [Mycolicibacterium smegmatis MC2 155]AIU12456.1 hypothetical protein LI99_02790 [Mycolicibacterium smegmatis]AIU19080.1 hypothetical protein LI98_02790 [Mycolicibacterium smegmatis]
MALIPMPHVDVADEQVAAVLSRAVGPIGLILDAVADLDPLGLRRRTHYLGEGDGVVGTVLDRIACVLDCADIPGTRSWEGKDRAERIGWWVHGVGALDTVVVAFPGVFGVVADRLPLQDLLGFTNQALVLCAVAREYGVTDHDTQVRMLAAVLCGRDLAQTPQAQTEDESGDMSLVQRVWHLAGILNAIGDELGRRPHPRAPFRYLGMLPWVGAVADYLGEYGALVRAADAGQKWIAQHGAAADDRAPLRV